MLKSLSLNVSNGFQPIYLESSIGLLWRLVLMFCIWLTLLHHIAFHTLTHLRAHEQTEPLLQFEPEAVWDFTVCPSHSTALRNWGGIYQVELQSASEQWSHKVSREVLSEIAVMLAYLGIFQCW